MDKKWTVILRTQGLENELELKNAINSLIAQDYKNISVIIPIHNDSDKIIKDTLTFLEPYRDLIDINTLVLKEKQNIRSYPLNQALNILNSEYVSFLDHDDIYYPRMGSLLISLLEKNKTSFAYGTSVKVLQEEKKDKFGNRYLYTVKKSLFETKNFNIISFLLDNYIPFNTFVIKTSLIGKEEFDERLDYLEDWDFLRKMSLKEDFSFIQTKYPVSEYRIRQDNTDSFNEKNYSKWVKSRKISDRNIENKEILIDLKTINQFEKEDQKKTTSLLQGYEEKINSLNEEINKIKNNPAYRIWVHIRDMKIVNKTFVRLIRYIRVLFNRK